MLMQTGQLSTGSIEVVQNDLTIGGSGGYMRVELPMRPLDVLDAQAGALSGLGMVGEIDDGSTQVGLLDDPGIVLLLNTYRLQDLLAGQDCMGAVTVDVEGLDGQTRLVACILRRASADARRLSTLGQAGQGSRGGVEADASMPKEGESSSGGGSSSNNNNDDDDDTKNNNNSSSSRQQQQR